jgi:hypothetical protein
MKNHSNDGPGSGLNRAPNRANGGVNHGNNAPADVGLNLDIDAPDGGDGGINLDPNAPAFGDGGLNRGDNAPIEFENLGGADTTDAAFEDLEVDGHIADDR